ncbi:uroporphyrinogen-III C-methyltransferase [Glaciecola sp. SC05]|uniref:uroporphyrinogen-III C-methyltransferase n=1 Tax=Glaciecola sp. SC05 TaxID=1987355 RepID=UPI0035274BA5
MTNANESKSVSKSTKTEDIEDGVVIDSTPSSKSKEPEQKKPSSKGLWFFTILNFLLVITICGAGYWYYMQEHQTQQQIELDQQAFLAARSNDLSDLTSSLMKTERSVEALANELNTKNQSLSQSMDNLLSQVLENSQSDKALERQIAEISGRRPSDWLLAEASYLVNMAGRKLYLEQDIRTSITLLNEADARLQDLGDPSLLPIRALIARDIQTLQQVNPVSTTSIALAISGMLPQVANLPLENLKLPETNIDSAGPLTNEMSDWQENLKRTWRSIVGDFISIKRIDKPLEPYLAERQQWLIEQQVKHALTQAQTAALNEQYTLYSASLQQAMALIIEHYQIEDNNVSQFMNALQQLQTTNFERDYPERLTSIEALKDALERRVERQFNNRDDSL